MEEKLIEPNTDMSMFIMLTPTEVKNLLRDFAFRFTKAKIHKEDVSVNELCDTYYDMNMIILKHTDPDRFINRN